MARSTPPKRDPLLLEIAAAIGAGRIAIGPIPIEADEHECVYGDVQKDGRIRVDPTVNLVATVLHECIHRLRPNWKERTVRRREMRLMAGLTRAELTVLDGMIRVQANN